MKRSLVFSTLLILTILSCNLASPSGLVATETATNTLQPTIASFTPPPPTETASIVPTASFTETPTPSETPTLLPSDTPPPTVESLKAEVIAPLVSCRYGPGPNYLYLFAFRRGAEIKLIGRVDAQNWDWVLVENKTPCWIKAIFLDVQGYISDLPVVYPGVAKLPITPYWPPTQVLNAQRNNQTNEIMVSWVKVPVSPGHYEDENMQPYIVEVWRCQDGQLVFDPLATSFEYISFVDEPGCSEPSHGRIWVQDKHGFAGPAEIPWPPYSTP